MTPTPQGPPTADEGSTPAVPASPAQGRTTARRARSTKAAPSEKPAEQPGARRSARPAAQRAAAKPAAAKAAAAKPGAKAAANPGAKLAGAKPAGAKAAATPAATLVAVPVAAEPAAAPAALQAVPAETARTEPTAGRPAAPAPAAEAPAAEAPAGELVPAADGGLAGALTAKLTELAGATAEIVEQAVEHGPETVARAGKAVGEAVGSVREALDPRSVVARLDPVGFAPAVVKGVRALVKRPGAVVRGGAGLSADTGRAARASLSRAVGRSATGPAALAERDRRYGDPAWEGNAWYYLLRQEHEVFAHRLAELAAAVDVDPVTRRKLDFLIQQIVEAAQPVNWPASNPELLKKALDTGGQSLVRGLRNYVRDLLTNGGFPRQTVPGTFEVGRDLAATPGKVVYHNHLMELIQYSPQTEQVHEIPLLMSPPWINKYYIMDLRPGKSLVEWAVRHGHTVFMISYRNPDSAYGDVSMSDYLRKGPLAALDVIKDITGAEKVNVAALCLGGTLAASTAAWLAAQGSDRINSITLMNTLLDFTEPGQLGVFTDEGTVDRLESTMRRRGYLPAGDMKRTFDLLRPADLVWNYVISGWLKGEDPAAFDMLSWNADSTRMPAAMHVEYLRTCYLDNQLAEGKLELAGERLDLGEVRQDSYVITAEKDHIAPWTSVYRGARLLGGDVRFVLSNSGHIAGVVNPPSPKSRFWVDEGGELPVNPQTWHDGATEHRASWWEDWSPWIEARAGALRIPPPIGSAAHPAVGPAPGEYVLERS